MLILTVLFSFIATVQYVNSHGMMLDPPNRSSLWRFDSSAPANYEDNQNFCGGFGVQWYTNGGKCGVCGDNYQNSVPRANENTGKYGRGQIVKIYNAGSVIEISSLLTANHLGKITYSLCQITNSSKPESGENCFNALVFDNGATEAKINSNDKQLMHRIRLPPGFTCTHCVLRWQYTCGNNWGVCEDGTGAMGCGPQEIFRSCADIKIV